MIRNEIHLGWQDAETRRWYAVGRFWLDDDGYSFEYLPQADKAREQAGFGGVPQFPDFARSYRSEEAFAFLRNRLIRPKRYDFMQQQRRLGLEAITDLDDPADVFEILARTGGRRQTDNFEFFRPLRAGDDKLECIFFSRGLTYIDEKIRQFWADGSTPKGELRLVADLQNPVDPNALIIIDEAIRPLGFVPRYYSAAFSRLFHDSAIDSVTIERHNKSPAPDQERFLLRLEATAVEEHHLP